MRKILSAVSWLFKISRFPYFWINSGGSFLVGVSAAMRMTFAGGNHLWLPLLWFVVPANIYLNAINDAYDSETDANNPRKHSVEMASKKEDEKTLFLTAFVSLVSAVMLYRYATPLTAVIFAVWASIIVLYNVPPFRFKTVPGMNVLFGGTGHYVPIIVMGYAMASGQMPPPGFILVCILFFSAGHILIDSLDIPYDRAAGIKTLGVWLGSAEESFMLSIFVYVAAAIISFVISGNPLIALIGSVFPLFVLFQLWEGNIEKRCVQIYRHFNYFYVPVAIAAAALVAGNMI